jgi:phosphatidylglycerophosphatase A
MILLILAGSILCVTCAPATITATGKADPPEVVTDEFAGQALTFVIIGALVSGHYLLSSVVGLLLFRFFDILKPWPIRKIEKLPRGWGILADDLLAGVYAGIVLLLFLRLYSHWIVR